MNLIFIFMGCNILLLYKYVYCYGQLPNLYSHNKYFLKSTFLDWKNEY